MAKKHYGSLFESEQELLKSILEIHNGGDLQFSIDPMYNKGKFYKDNILYQPLFAFELNPEKYCKREKCDHKLCYYNGINVSQGDALKLYENLNELEEYEPEEDKIKSIVLDPPFMWRKMVKSKSLIADRYTMFETWEELKTLYKGIIEQSYKTLDKKGLLVFKCQDFTNSKTTMTHIYVHKWLEEAGFYVKDLAILNKPNKISNPNTTQRHFRKTHTYFWVAIKK